MIISTEEGKAGAIICDLFLFPFEFDRIVDLKDVKVDQKVCHSVWVVVVTVKGQMCQTAHSPPGTGQIVQGVFCFVWFFLI